MKKQNKKENHSVDSLLLKRNDAEVKLFRVTLNFYRAIIPHCEMVSSCLSPVTLLIVDTKQ